MSSIHDRLQQLLDGELDPSEIADDPTLVSLADRLYGIKIAAVQPVKPRDAQGTVPLGAPLTEVAPPTDMLVEVIGPVVPVEANVPLPGVPQPNLDIPPMPSKKGNPLRWVAGGGLLVGSSTCSVCFRRCSKAPAQPGSGPAEVQSKLESTSWTSPRWANPTAGRIPCSPKA